LPNRISAAVAAFAVLSIQAFAEPIPRNSVELSGLAEFNRTTVNDRDIRSLVLQPAAYWYPNSNAFLGPSLVMAQQWVDETEIGTRQLSLEGGLISGIGSLPVFLYAGAGAGILQTTLEGFVDSTGFGESEDGSVGHAFSLFFGGKLRLAGAFHLNVQPSWEFITIDRDTRNGFRLKLGFSGLLSPR
jgi:hypothetical protein